METRHTALAPHLYSTFTFDLLNSRKSRIEPKRDRHQHVATKRGTKSLKEQIVFTNTHSRLRWPLSLSSQHAPRRLVTHEVTRPDNVAQDEPCDAVAHLSPHPPPGEPSAPGAV
eukprot:361217-Prorocentrum_minimum.AAC.3